MNLWNDKQFWLDTSWRSLRTFCQSLAGLLAAQFSGLLQATGVTSGALPHTPWAGFLYASAVAALISLLQSIDRGREAQKVTATQTPVLSPTPAVLAHSSDEVVTTCGDALR